MSGESDFPENPDLDEIEKRMGIDVWRIMKFLVKHGCAPPREAWYDPEASEAIVRQYGFGSSISEASLHIHMIGLAEGSMGTFSC